ncbi:hypothetical protein CCAND93_60034 [Capnocytophaga canis]|uniref:Uncharacterized protein n=1 Tax=Capnocytophaga canis TaxID=1848903 RepID=A0A0B7ITC6_9FLAO|nr:hypothetical protein CCAND93_60034 [Capnocytophaga canis]
MKFLKKKSEVAVEMGAIQEVKENLKAETEGTQNEEIEILNPKVVLHPEEKTEAEDKKQHKPLIMPLKEKKENNRLVSLNIH